jgi:uncharacterized membrane protein YqjE
VSSTETEMQSSSSTNKSMAELTEDLTHQMTELVHHEIELAKIELTEKGKRAGLGGGLLGGAGIMGLAAFGCVTVCIIAALHHAIPIWLASLIVAVVYGLVGGTLAMAGRNELRRATPPVPSEAVDSTKEDVAWIKTQAKSGRR